MTDQSTDVRRPVVPVGVEVTDAGTQLSALVGAGKASRHLRERLTAPLSPEEARDAIAEISLRAVAQWSRSGAAYPSRVALGVTVSGRVQATSGVVLRADGLPTWTGFALGQELRQRFAQVTIESAVNAAALAEAWAGAAGEYSSALYVSLGRRVSLAVVVDGAVIRGAHEGAGQLGHWQLAEAGPRCACGAQGHLDPVSSAQSIVRNMIGLASDSERSHAEMLRVAHGRAEAMSAAQVLELADEGEPAARTVINAAVDGLSSAIANVVAALDPGVVVVDGPFAARTEALLDRLRDRVHALTATFAEPVPIVASHFGSLGALEGARLLAERAVVGASNAG